MTLNEWSFKFPQHVVHQRDGNTFIYIAPKQPGHDLLAKLTDCRIVSALAGVVRLAIAGQAQPDYSRFKSDKAGLSQEI